MNGMLSHIVKVLEAKKIFERNRKDMKYRALGILLYHYGLSLRKCESVISSFKPVSYEAIRKWYHKADQLFTIETGYHEVAAVDESENKWKVVHPLGCNRCRNRGCTWYLGFKRTCFS